MAMAKQIKTYSQSGDILDNTYFDTAVLDSATVNYDLFSTPISATVKKDITNMTDVGQFPTGKQFQVRQLGVKITDRKAAGALLTTTRLNLLLATLGRATLTFNIIGKQDMGEWPLTEWLGTTSFAHAPATAGDSDSVGLDTFYQPWKKLRYPINLDQRVRFNVELKFNGLTSLSATLDDIAIQFCLKGIEQRRK